jgi:hypothetical protein
MKTATLLTACALTLALVAGCVPSLNPVYTEKDLVVKPELAGTFQPENKDQTWKFVQQAGKAFQLIHTDQQGNEGRFIAHLAEVEGLLFLDLAPEKSQVSENGLYQFHLAPIHTIYLVKGTAPDLRLAAIDYNWLEKTLREDPDVLQHSLVDGRLLITAPTEEVQAFLVAHADAFTGDFSLRRVAGSAN